MLLPALLLQGSAIADTQIVRLIPPDPTGAQQAMAVATVFAVLLPYLIFGAAIWAALRARRSFEQAKLAVDGLGARLETLTDSANRIAADVASVTNSVKDNVSAMADTVDYANQRARDAVSGLADRVDEFNHTLAVMQRDTQQMAVAAIAAFRGVRAGVDALRAPKRRRAATAEPAGEEPEEQEVAPDLPARPRLRRRARGDR